MGRWQMIVALGLLPGQAWADCVYTGAKRAYLECIYASAVDAAAEAASAVAGLVGLESWSVGVDGSLGMLSSDLSTLSGRVDGVDTTLGMLSSDLGALSSRADGVDAALALLGPEVTGLGGRLDAAELAIAAVTGDLSALSSTVATISGSLAVYDAADVVFDTRLDGLDTSVSGLSSSLSVVSADVAALEAAQGDLDGDVGALTTAVGALQTSLATQTTRVNQLYALEHMRSILPKAAATGHCPTGTAIHVPLGWAGRTGNEICAADSRGLTHCASVQYVYITNGNSSGSYDVNNLACSQSVVAPWPWGYSTGTPNSLDAEWGHGDTYVVCCN
jgi:hypothetical protein